MDTRDKLHKILSRQSPIKYIKESDKDIYKMLIIMVKSMESMNLTSRFKREVKDGV
jgi:ABC-type uncharacterized transport system permease subunit